MAKREEFRVDLTANDQASGTIDAVASKVESVTGAEVEITATDEATEVVEGVAEEVAALDGETAEAELTADDEATEVVSDVSEAVEDLDGAAAEATLEADDQATEVVADAESAVDGFDGESATASLGATDDASETADEAVTALEGVEDTFTASVEVVGADDAEAALRGISSHLGDAGGAAALTVAGLLAIGSSASDQILEVAALSEAIGAPLDQTSRLKEVWDLAGGSIDTLERNVIRANEKIRESPELAAALGIEIGENTSAYDIFVGAVNALNSGQLTANERLALAMEVFGARGILLLDDLQTRVGDIDEAMAGVGENELITQEQVDQAIEFQAQWDAVGDKLSEIQRDILPAVNLALEGLVGIMDGRLLTAVENIADRLTPDWLFGDGNVLDELMGEGPNFETVTPTPEQVELVNDYLATHDELGNEVLPATAESLDDVTGATDAAAEAAAAHAEELEKQREALEESAEAQRDLIDATREATDDVYAARKAQRDYRSQVLETQAALQDQENSADDDAQALDDLALAAGDSARRQAELSGAAEDSTKFIDLENSSLLGMAANMDGPMQRAILGYIANLNGIPDDIKSEIEALINQGKLAEAERLLNNTSRTRQAAIQASSDQHQIDLIENRLNNLARARYVSIIARGASGAGDRNRPRAVATGHPFTPSGWYRAGEQGEELIELPLGSRVHDAAATSALDAAGGGAPVREGDVIINLPAGTTASGMAAAARRHSRRNGAIPLLA